MAYRVGHAIVIRFFMSDFIMISNPQESYPIPVDGIIRLEACEGKTFIITDYLLQHVFSYNLGEAEKLLNEKFFRAHNSHIINIRHVKKITRGRTYRLTMTCKSEVPVSSRNVAEFRKIYFS